MPDYDRSKLAFAVAGRLEALGRDIGRDGPLPFDAFCRRHPGLTPTVLSRVRNGAVISVGNYLAVCRAAMLDPYHFFLPDAAEPRGHFGRAHRSRIQRLAVDTRETGNRETAKENAHG